MVDVGVSIAAKLAEYLIEPTIQQGLYLFCGAKIKRKFESEKEKLLSTQEGVQKRVEEARRRTDTIDNAVNMWINDVNSLIKDLDDLEQEIKEKKSCFGMWSPNWPSYCLSKQMAKKIERMVQLNANHEFNPFSHPIPIQDIEYFSSENFMYFESTTLASNQLLEALEDANCYMIGFHGMGGSGKTTLAKEVAKKAKESKILDRAILTTVSQTPNVRKIQGEIIDLLGEKFTEETEAGRARRISSRLRSGERILVILDDVWAKLNLEDIGIPLNGNQHGCKLLLTTRREQVCTLMECEKRIPLHLLSENEAWTLFNKHARINDVTSQGVAQEVAKECKGLPIAIVAVGRCMKESDLDGIKVVLNKLRHSKPIDVDEGEKDVFGCLRLSYDYLKNKESKLLFLMCAVFPEDHRIDPEVLFRYGIGSNVCKQVDSFETARSCVNVAINCLIESSLLMRDNDSNGNAFYRMHDMVRDVALWIASYEDRAIVVSHSTKQNASLEDGFTRDCYALSCWNMDKNLPQQLDALKLEMLLLNIEENDLDFSLPSFEGFKGMKVMAITKHNVWHTMKTSLIWSHSTHLLTNLRTMRLVGMKLDDISFVVSLRNLQILDFQWSVLKELPNGLEKLNKLKLLDLSNCHIDGHCYEVIKRCLQLEELYVQGSRENAFIDSDTFCLEDVTFSKLQRYQLDVGGIASDFYNVNLCKRSLYVGGLNVSISSANIKDLLRRAIKVGLKMLKGGCKNVIPELVQVVGGMNELIGLYLKSCSELECVFNTTSLMASSFDVSIVVQSLLLVQELQIVDCSELKYIMTSGEHNNNRGKQIVTVPDIFYLSFSQLKKLHIHECYKLEYIFPISMVQRLEQLEEISIINAPYMKYLFSELDHEYLSSDQNQIQIVLPRLKIIIFKRLLNLVNFFPDSCPYELRWPFLAKFSCEDCPKLTIGWTGSTYNKVNLEQRQSFLNKEAEVKDGKVVQYEIQANVQAILNVNEEGALMIVSNLEKFYLKHLDEVEYIWKGPILISLRHLKELRVEGCRKLRCIFTSVVIKNLPLLEYMIIIKCEELEEIISLSEDDANFPNPSSTTHHLQQPCFPKLQFLEVEGCNRLRCVFPLSISQYDLPCLLDIDIRSCEQIEEVFGCEKIKDSSTNNKKEIVLPNLTMLNLERLASLVDICQGFTFHAVKLTKVWINECPKFAPFLRGNQEIPIDKSKKGEAHEMQTDLQAILNVNEGEGAMTMVSNLGYLELKNIGEMEFLWKGPTLISFQHLQVLRVEGCRKLRCIFSSAVIKSLPLLYMLNIINCEELEEIILLSEEEANLPNLSSTTHHLQQPCFPKLKFLIVEGCDRLRCVFPFSISLYDLPCLWSLQIRRCSLVEQVFGCAPQNHHRHDAEMMEFQLSQLEYLTLEELPSLTNFCRGFESHLILEALGMCEVKDCPKFSSTIIPALHKFITHKDENKEEEKESNIDDNVDSTSHNIEDINDEVENEDVGDEKKNKQVEDGEEDDKDEDTNLDGSLDNNN
ncbi:disease resistance protein [Senna tora]|uniref:Disease resistance protein n=1 Tax=Senna tora TaxID=362788 RepID=A0A834WVA8_9FABA|nr:disease resistance protein [Senna tora]